jgi:hypothetical protein
MAQAPAPCMDRNHSVSSPAQHGPWQALLAVSAVQVRIAFDSPWAAAQRHAQGGDRR